MAVLFQHRGIDPLTREGHPSDQGADNTIFMMVIALAYITELSLPLYVTYGCHYVTHCCYYMIHLCLYVMVAITPVSPEGLGGELSITTPSFVFYPVRSQRQ